MCARTLASPNGPDGSAPVESADVHAQLKQLAGELRKAVLHVAWRQWRALGAGAAPRSGTVGRHLKSLIDPEALVLVSLLLEREERRLPDLLHDWAAKNADLLSVQRMKNLEVGYPDRVRSVLAPRLAWFASVAYDVGKDLRWRSVGQAWVERSRNEHTRSGGAPDAVHEITVRSGKSRATRARLTSDSSLVLRLRLGFGVGVKADLLAFLLARAEDWATVRDISDATAYTSAAVRRAAEDLAASRLVQVLEGQPASYRVTYGTWAPLLELADRPPRWGSWHQRFLFAAEFLAWVDALGTRPASAYAVGTQGRELLERHRAAFERDLVAVWSEHSRIQDWAPYLVRAVGSLRSWMEELA